MRRTHTISDSGVNVCKLQCAMPATSRSGAVSSGAREPRAAATSTPCCAAPRPLQPLAQLASLPYTTVWCCYCTSSSCRAAGHSPATTLWSCSAGMSFTAADRLRRAADWLRSAADASLLPLPGPSDAAVAIEPLKSLPCSPGDADDAGAGRNGMAA